MDVSLMKGSLVLFVGTAPLLLVYLLGIVLALVFWARKPKAGVLTLIASLLLLILTLAGVSLELLPISLQSRGWSMQQIGTVMGIINIIHNLFMAVGIGLLLAAVFCRDNRKQVASSDSSALVKQP